MCGWVLEVVSSGGVILVFRWSIMMCRKACFQVGIS